MPTKRTKHSPCRVWSAIPFLGFLLALTLSAQQGASVSANVADGDSTARRSQVLAIPAIAAVPEGFEQLALAPGFLLQIEVYGIPEMNVQLRIDAQGNVTIPLVGALHLAGKTTAQAQEAIARAFADREILKDPQVNLTVLQYAAASVSVMGEVQTPGRIPLLASAPLGDVLALAGGETPAAGDEIEIQRHDTNGKAASDRILFAQDQDPALLRNILVGPGDTVLVDRAGIVYVLGAVNRPGGYRMVNRGSLSVLQAVALAGGETRETSHRAVVVRKKDGSIEQIKLSLLPMEKGQAEAVPLQRDDVVYLPASGWKSVALNGSSVLSAAAAASVYAISSHP
ncbi:MAG TPA: polysaccharide biosynthesis/export family protein [Terracidiphilus sp.]|jgi:polysaccharide export outer membrane protein|nr:polysaccharide biosynthesis/export family protein [Terracidiphilus sp.]